MGSLMIESLLALVAVLSLITNVYLIRTQKVEVEILPFEFIEVEPAEAAPQNETVAPPENITAPVPVAAVSSAWNNRTNIPWVETNQGTAAPAPQPSRPGPQQRPYGFV